MEGNQIIGFLLSTIFLSDIESAFVIYILRATYFGPSCFGNYFLKIIYFQTKRRRLVSIFGKFLSNFRTSQCLVFLYAIEVSGKNDIPFWAVL